jgi:hypothetical protein
MPPFVSIVLPVKNGLPHIRTAIEAIRRQTHPECELIVQDGGSTDGTLEYLASLRDSVVATRVASAPDAGIGQAYGRALKRASGDLICFAAADEYLEDDAVARAVGWFARNRDAVLVNGSVRMADRDDRPVDVFDSPHFDLIGHLKCEVVLPFAGLFDRRKIGNELYYDESLKTCPDYDFWIRLGARFEPRQFVAVKQIFKTARADRASMSFRTESFDQFCRDKRLVLDRFLDAQPRGPVTDALRRTATAGIFAWAAESVLALEGPSPAFIKWCAAAATVEPWSRRLQALAVQTAAFAIEPETGRLLVAATRQPDQPSVGATRVFEGLAVDRAFSLPHWSGAGVEAGDPVVVQTGAAAWTYAAEIPCAAGAIADDLWCWARLDLEVMTGQVGIGPVVGNDLLYEETVPASKGRTTLFLKIADPRVTGIMIRNSGLAAPSRVRIFGASFEREPKSA